MQWIDIKTKKPRILETVLCCLENNSIFMFNYIGNGQFCITFTTKEAPENNKITHWMSLPKPPKK